MININILIISNELEDSINWRNRFSFSSMYDYNNKVVGLFIKNKRAELTYKELTK